MISSWTFTELDNKVVLKVKCISNLVLPFIDFIFLFVPCGAVYKFKQNEKARLKARTNLIEVLTLMDNNNGKDLGSVSLWNYYMHSLGDWFMGQWKTVVNAMVPYIHALFGIGMVLLECTLSSHCNGSSNQILYIKSTFSLQEEELSLWLWIRLISLKRKSETLATCILYAYLCNRTSFIRKATSTS